MPSPGSSASDDHEWPSLRRAVLSPRYAARRLRTSVGRRGVLGTIRLAAWHAVEPSRAALRSLQERGFDMRHGTDTRGPLGTGPPIRGSVHDDSVGYGASRPARFRKLVAPLPVAAESLLFVDLGCGKGKTLLLAAATGFRRFLGVELSSELAAVARRNLAVCGIDAEIVEEDATNFDFPDDPLFVYLFNPFGEKTFRAVLDALERSLARTPRLVFLGYENAVHRELLESSGFLAVVAEGRGWVLYRAS